MKFLKLFMLLIILGSQFVFSVPQEDWDKDNYGKIVGYIIDAITGEPVSDIFDISLYNCSNISAPVHAHRITKSDNEGRFSIEIEPGIYCLHFNPNSNISQYGIEPDPIIQPGFGESVNVQSGMIVEIVKKVKPGGELKITFVDQNDQRIYPNLMLSKEDIKHFSGSIKAEGIIGPGNLETFSVNDDLKDGEILLTQLFPGKYTIYIKLPFMGFGYPIKIQDIKIERSKTTVRKVVLNYYDPTGIEGVITNSKMLPVVGTRVHIKEQETGMKYNIDILAGSTRTNDKGYYKIIGLKEGIYEISVHLKGFKFKDFRNIKIYKNSIVEKNLFLD